MILATSDVLRARDSHNPSPNGGESTISSSTLLVQLYYFLTSRVVVELMYKSNTVISYGTCT
jgi:hypothetical protein